MVTRAFLRAMVAPLTWLLSLIPEWDRPAWVETAIATANDLASGLADLGNILPLSVIAACLSFLGVVTAIALGIRVVNRLLSVFTGGGGA